VAETKPSNRNASNRSAKPRSSEPRRKRLPPGSSTAIPAIPRVAILTLGLSNLIGKAREALPTRREVGMEGKERAPREYQTHPHAEQWALWAMIIVALLVGVGVVFWTR